jgi:hypothetical protein
MVQDLKYLVPDYLWDAYISTVPPPSNEDETSQKPLTIVDLGKFIHVYTYIYIYIYIYICQIK